METQAEIWKDVKEYKGYYSISSLGSVKRLKSYTKHPKGGLKTVRERVLKQANSRGYRLVMLTVKGSRENKLVHRLVAQAFIPNPKNKPHVNHINGVKDDNKVSNLEWATASENELHKKHVLGKFSNALCLKHVNKVNPILQINNRKTIGVKLQLLYNDLKSGIRVSNKDTKYGRLYAQIHRLRKEFKVNVMDEFPLQEDGSKSNFKEWFLIKEKV